jgi:hypothetical protein
MRTLRTISILFLLASAGFAQQLRWSATTGNVSQTAATTTATIQQGSVGSQIFIDQIVVYCSVACVVSQAANGTAATATAGTVKPILPTPLQTVIPVNFFTASDVGSGTAQAGNINLPAATTVTLCLSPLCGGPGQVEVPTGSTSNNYSVTISAITGTSNITFYGRTQ